MSFKVTATIPPKPVPPNKLNGTLTHGVWHFGTLMGAFPTKTDAVTFVDFRHKFAGVSKDDYTIAELD